MKSTTCLCICITSLLFLSCSLTSKDEEEDNVPIVINEFMASNQTDTILDEFGDAADYIELYNNSDEPYNLKGLYLSDDSTNLDKFSLADTLLPARSHYLVWADENGSEGPNHANFRLGAAEGEEIILSNKDSQIIDRIMFYDIIPARQPNFAYGRTEDGGPDWSIQSTPTPNSANNTD